MAMLWPEVGSCFGAGFLPLIVCRSWGTGPLQACISSLSIPAVSALVRRGQMSSEAHPVSWQRAPVWSQLLLPEFPNLPLFQVLQPFPLGTHFFLSSSVAGIGLGQCCLLPLHSFQNIPTLSLSMRVMCGVCLYLCGHSPHTCHIPTLYENLCSLLFLYFWPCNLLKDILGARERELSGLGPCCMQEAPHMVSQ